MNNQEPIPEDIVKLVVLRLEALSSDKKISIGSFGEFSKEELITHVKKRDEIGKKLIEVELEFLRTLKEGIVV